MRQQQHVRQSLIATVLASAQAEPQGITPRTKQTANFTAEMKIVTGKNVRVAAFALFPILAFSQGGPPFRSDDPDTPGNGHWEINLGFIGERGPFGGSYETPDIDINYGVGNRLQLEYELPVGIQEIRGDSNH
jgi:hypothetical protein